jgi:hypothetical protein
MREILCLSSKERETLHRFRGLWGGLPGRGKELRNGMTESEVLDLLGKPRCLEKEHRPRDCWTVHYFYPVCHIVNFYNGLVVGKEIDYL